MRLDDILEKLESQEQAADITKARWYIIAAVALTAASAGPDVTKVYKKVTRGLSLDAQKLVQRRVKEAILKTSALYDGKLPKQKAQLLWKCEKARYEKARSYFDTIWTPKVAQANREHNFKYHHPDLYYLNTQLHYEYYISEDAILNPIETQTCNIAALICSNCPVQVMWHTRGLMNHGGSMQEAKFAHQIGLAIAKLSDSKVGDITPVERIDFEHYTPH
ncbi:hypothetical protein CSUB01_04283 [Colletotrichum sublineola]|uniref:Carboxymuconolactone decarboxylase-like domain-containing protein n=1 Tax=Colletotrichum sublineola TaxID=1173701 RepID=A0A066XF62_COLSU|nr:hypothetical protein CSUB01_04283 [Colletotrichum sublineola]